MADFSEEQKKFVVRCFAQRMGSGDIADAIAEQYAIAKPPSNQIARYNPFNKAGESLSVDLRQIFDEERARADTEIDDIDGAHQAFRLRELTDLYHRAKKMKNLPLAAKLLEQMAKERGDLYQARISPAEVDAYIERKGNALRAAVDTHVTNPQERDRVHAEVKKQLAGEGRPDTP